MIRTQLPPTHGMSAPCAIGDHHDCHDGARIACHCPCGHRPYRPDVLALAANTVARCTRILAVNLDLVDAADIEWTSVPGYGFTSHGAVLTLHELGTITWPAVP